MTRSKGILILILTILLIIIMNQLSNGETYFAQFFIGVLIIIGGFTSLIWLLTEVADYGYDYPSQKYSVYTPPKTTTQISRKHIETKVTPRVNIPQIEGKMLKVDCVESKTILQNPIEVSQAQLPTLGDLRETNAKTINEPLTQEVLGDDVIMIQNSDILHVNREKIYNTIIKYLQGYANKTDSFVQEKIKNIEYIDIINSIHCVIYVKNLKHFIIQHDLRTYIKSHTSFQKIEFIDYNHIKLEDYYNKQQNSNI